jgi:hypothetical protein
MMITEILNYSISFSLFHPTMFFFAFSPSGNRATTAGKVAVWKWIYIYHMVSFGSDKLCEYWAGEAVLVLVSNFAPASPLCSAIPFVILAGSISSAISVDYIELYSMNESPWWDYDLISWNIENSPEILWRIEVDFRVIFFAWKFENFSVSRANLDQTSATVLEDKKSLHSRQSQNEESFFSKPTKAEAFIAFARVLFSVTFHSGPSQHPKGETEKSL